MAQARYRWWHGVLFYAGVQAVSMALNRLSRKATHSGQSSPNTEVYKTARLPRFAPPAAVFPIAWSVNSACSIAGGLHVLDLPRSTAGRSEFLRLQGAAWALYSIFQAAYFGLRSPINAEIVTVLYSAATIASADVAIRQLHDTKAAASLATTLAWLALANPVGLAAAAWNYDSFWNAGPFSEPREEWLKIRAGESLRAATPHAGPSSDQSPRLDAPATSSQTMR